MAIKFDEVCNEDIYFYYKDVFLGLHGVYFGGC